MSVFLLLQPVNVGISHTHIYQLSMFLNLSSH